MKLMFAHFDDVERVGAASLAQATASPSDLVNLSLWAGEIEGRGACKHPDGAVHLLRSAAKVFAEDWDRPEASIYDEDPAR